MSEAASRPRLYLDTNVFIEMFEKRGAVSDRLLDLFGGPTLPRHHLVTSQLTIAEILVDAIRADDMQRNDLYLGFLRDIPNLMTVAPISRDVLIRAALIRARQPRIKLPDAIHLSTSHERGSRSAARAPGMSEVSLLSVRDLSVAFRQGGRDTLAVDRISFDVAPRETVAIVGESGSGKSVSALSVL